MKEKRGNEKEKWPYRSNALHNNLSNNPNQVLKLDHIGCVYVCVRLKRIHGGRESINREMVLGALHIAVIIDAFIGL